MERKVEITKLVNVLKHTARAATQPEWSEDAANSSEICVARFNKILARLSELEPNLDILFEPLPQGIERLDSPEE